MDVLKQVTQEPPAYDGFSDKTKNHFPSLIDLALEAVHMGAEEQAQRLLGLRDFLIKHFDKIDAIKYAETEFNEAAYEKKRPRQLR